jgi:hypothetical protein
MIEDQALWLTFTAGSLILVLAGLRSYRLGIGKMAGMAMIWIGIFACAALIASAVAG